MYVETHSHEPVWPYPHDASGGGPEIRLRWHDAGSGLHLFTYGGRWRISGRLDALVRINGRSAEPAGVVNGFPAWRANGEAGGPALWLFLDAGQGGWVVSENAELPREFEYERPHDPDDEDPALPNQFTVFGGNAWWGPAAELPIVNGPAARLPARGSKRGSADGSPGPGYLEVEAEWDYWEGGATDAHGNPACGVYSPAGGASGTRTVGHPCWTEMVGGEPVVRFLMADATHMVDGDAPGAPVAKADGWWLLRAGEGGAWRTRQDPVVGQPWEFPWVWDEDWAGERPEVGAVVLDFGRRIRRAAAREYVYSAPRVP